MKHILWLLVTFLISCHTAVAEPLLTLRSSVQQTGLLELYTSEGCSSCPPADRWISTLKDDPRLWKELIPMAFHVNYWNYIGWKDRFSSAAYSQRQREYARQRAIQTVYTPGFVFNGQEWRSWLQGRTGDFPSPGKTGVLEVDVARQIAKVRFQPSNPVRQALTANIALLGFGLSTNVQAGENTGRRLYHDFVVLGTQQNQLVASNGNHVGSVSLPDKNLSASQYGVVVWVSSIDSQGPLQAVGGWLPQ